MLLRITILMMLLLMVMVQGSRVQGLGFRV
jgi:hypothetical protein